MPFPALWIIYKTGKYNLPAALSGKTKYRQSHRQYDAHPKKNLKPANFSRKKYTGRAISSSYGKGKGPL